MPTLKWGNVTGDDTNAGADSLKSAGSLFSKAFENFSGAVEGRKKRETKDNTDSLSNRIRSIGSREELDAAEAQFGDFQGVKDEFGGNVDTSALSKELFAKRGYLDQQEASALTKENAAYQLDRSRTADARADETRLRQEGAQQFASGLNREQRTLESRNQAAFNQAIAAEQDRTEGPGQIQLDSAGNVITAPQATLAVQEQFKADVIAAGGGDIQSIKQLRDKADAYADAQSLSPTERTALHESIAQQYDRSVFSAKEQTTIDKEASVVNTARDSDIASVDSITERAVSRISEGTAPNAKEAAQDKTSFLTRVRTLSPNKTITGFTGSGGTQGGAKLVNIIDTIMRDEFPQLEAWEVEQFLIGNVDGENDAWFSFDTNADIDDLRANLTEYTGQRGGSYQSRAAGKVEALYSAAIAQKNDIRSKAAKKNSSALALRETAAGKVSRGKNVGVFNPTTNTTTAQAEAGLKQEVRKPVAPNATKPGYSKESKALLAKGVNTLKKAGNKTSSPSTGGIDLTASRGDVIKAANSAWDTSVKASGKYNSKSDYTSQMISERNKLAKDTKSAKDGIADAEEVLKRAAYRSSPTYRGRLKPFSKSKVAKAEADLKKFKALLNK